MGWRSGTSADSFLTDGNSEQGVRIVFMFVEHCTKTKQGLNPW